MILAPLAALAMAASAGQPVDDPVAVMPFKNLSQEQAYDWLKVGVAETMVADLRRAGRVRVVERDQIDRAMAELALQGASGTEESTAARVGKLVGAKTILVGSFQKSGGQLRFVARFVAVETGVVVDAVKVTGPLANVLALQDQIIARLLGLKAPTEAGAPPKRKASPKLVEAYKLYAMSLTTASDADRVGYLKQSLQLDPDFSYALEELVALEKRMRGYADERDRKLAERARADEEVLLSESARPEDRAQKAMQMLTGDLQSFRYKALLRDAQRIARLDLPPVGAVPLEEFASYCIFLAHQSLKQTDLALQAGERHLKAFPAGIYGQGVQLSMQALINDRFYRERRRGEAEKDLAELEREPLADERGRPLAEHVVRTRAFRRCSLARDMYRPAQAEAECGAYVERYGSSADPEVRKMVNFARYHMINAWAEAGDFDRARREAERLLETEPEFARTVSLPMVLSTWPRD